MRNRLFSSGAAHYVDNPKNFTHQHQTATENFHLVKRVMSVRPTVKNQHPKKFTHLNTNFTRLKSTTVST